MYKSHLGDSNIPEQTGQGGLGSVRPDVDAPVALGLWGIRTPPWHWTPSEGGGLPQVPLGLSVGLGQHCPTECQDTPHPSPARAQHCPGWNRVGHVANHTSAQVLGAVHPLTSRRRHYTTPRRRPWAAPPARAAQRGDPGLRDSEAKPGPASRQGPRLPSGGAPVSRGQAQHSVPQVLQGERHAQG